jgi:CubicO group peptidase (beta-lactamase class C family)
MVSELGFDSARLARVGARIDAEIAAQRYDGAALVVGRHGRTVLRSVHGYADRAEGRLLGDRDVFATMSLGKQFTHVLVLNRIDRGELHLHMHVHEVIPEFRDNGLRTMTLFHLLTHTSGLESEFPYLPLEILGDIGKLTAHVASRRPESTPGTRVNYSNIAAASVMAEMVRRVDGGTRTFTQIITQDLFEPLGMKDTCLGARADLLGRLCPVKPVFTGPGVIKPEMLAGVATLLGTEGVELPAGGYLTTLDDVHRFATMLRNGGELDGQRVLSPRLIDLCARNWTGSQPNPLFDYTRDTRGWEPWPASLGIGFWVRGEGIQPGPMSNYSSPRTYGGWGAGSTCFWVDPELDLTFSFLSVGIMEAPDHMERVQRLSDLVISALVG